MTTSTLYNTTPLSTLVLKVQSYGRQEQRDLTDPDDIRQDILLRLITLSALDIAIVTDGLFGRTRSGQSTVFIIAVQCNTRESYILLLRHLKGVVNLTTPTSIDKAQDRRNTNLAEHLLRTSRENQIRRDYSERWAKGEWGQPHTPGVDAKYRLAVLKALPTQGRDLFRMLSIWGLISHPINGPAPLHAQIVANNTLLSSQLMKLATR